jgi:transposase
MASHASSAADAVTVGPTGRRRFTPEFKRHLVELTLHPGASVAGIALAHHLNANQLFKWRREYLRQREAPPVTPPPVLLPVEIVAERTPVAADPEPAPEPPPAPAGVIEIELGGARVRVSGDVDPAMLRTVLTSLRGR